MSEIVTWLFENAKRIDRNLFSDTSINWNKFEQVHILTMRALTPSGVFISDEEMNYLNRVSENPELTRLSVSIFKDDYNFIANLPEDLKNLKAQLVTLMRMAYTQQIRPADYRVKNM